MTLSIKTGHSVLRFGLMSSHIHGRVAKSYPRVVKRGQNFGGKRLRFVTVGTAFGHLPGPSVFLSENGVVVRTRCDQECMESATQNFWHIACLPWMQLLWYRRLPSAGLFINMYDVPWKASLKYLMG